MSELPYLLLSRLAGDQAALPPKAELTLFLESFGSLETIFPLKACIIAWLALQYVKFAKKDSNEAPTALIVVGKLLEIIPKDDLEPIKIAAGFEYILGKLGRDLISLEEYDLALKVLRVARDQARIDANPVANARISHDLAFTYHKNNEPEKAARLFEISSALDQETSLLALENAAALRYKTKEFPKAIINLENALKIAVKDGNPISKVLLSRILDLKREILIKGLVTSEQQIFSLIEEIANRLKTLDEPKETAGAYYECGMILERLGYLETAIQYYEQSAKLAYDNQLWSLYGRVSLQLGLLSVNQNDLEIARSYYDQIRQISDYSADEALASKAQRLGELISRAGNLLEFAVRAEKDKVSSQDLEVPSPSESSSSIPLNLPQTPGQSELSPSEEAGRTAREVFNEIIPKSPSTNDMEREQTNENLVETELPTSTEILTEPEVVLQAPSAVEGINEVESSPIADDIQTALPESFEETRNVLQTFLTRHGFSVEVDLTPAGSTSSIDIVASKGNVRRKRLFIMISASPSEASIAGYLLHGISAGGKKLIVLLGGQLAPSSPLEGIDVVTSLQELRTYF